MSLNSQDFSDLWVLWFLIEEDDYQPLANQPLIVKFAPTSFFPPLISTGWSIDEEVDCMDEMSLKSLWISYCIPFSITLERTRENDKIQSSSSKSCHHASWLFYTWCRSSFPFFFLGICLAILCALLLNWTRLYGV